MNLLLVAIVLAGAWAWVRGRGGAARWSGWRITSGAAAVATFTAAAYVGLRGGWGKTIVLAAVGVVLTLSTRWPRTAIRTPAQETMSLGEARALLGVPPDASAEDIRSAYGRLIRLAHPDRGGTHGLAVQLNRARDRLLKA